MVLGGDRRGATQGHAARAHGARRHPSAAPPQSSSPLSRPSEGVRRRVQRRGAAKGAAKGQRRPALAAGDGNAAMAVTRLHVVLRRLCRSVDRWVSSSATTLLLTYLLTYTLLCHSSVPRLAGSFLLTSSPDHFGLRSFVITPSSAEVLRSGAHLARSSDNGRSDGLSSAHAPPGWRISLRAAARRASAHQRCAQALLHRHGGPCLRAQDPARRCAQLVRARVSQLKLVDVRSAVCVPCTPHVQARTQRRVRGTACACGACAPWRVRCG
jgi:hypothetical protein